MEYPLRIVSYGYSEHKSQFVYPSGVHERAWVMFVLEEGSFRFSIDGVEAVAAPGDVVLGPPGKVLFREAISVMNIHYMIFSPSAGEGAGGMLDWVRTKRNFKLAISDKPRLFSSLQLMKPSSDRQDQAHMLVGTHYLNDIWIMLMHEFSRQSSPTQVIPDERMLLAQSRLKEHADQPLRLGELAAELGVSPVDFTRRFKACFGQSPKEYLTMVKLERAKSLLSNTNYTMEHIASLCGYESGYYFSRIFQKHAKIRPSVYRKIYSL
ncbi:MAG: hypothetical protein K0R57_3348 [Paenibacillaceae bacterium]|nr:hypothetical protein [Paenibacillaceae bacterium]